MRHRSAVVLIAIALLAIGCTPREKSAAGFRLPDGDAAAGREAFVALKCNSCHEVEGVDFPGPFADPIVPVRLGGDVAYARTDGELVTAIVNPSHRIASGHPTSLVQTGTHSRMGDFGDVMTVRQLIDIVAFLHDRYHVVPPEGYR
jgi:hypothetical protein